MAFAKQPFLTKPVKITGTLGLAVLAAAANNLNVPLFHGVDFIFGSIAVMLAILFLGTIPAVLVALASGLVTLILWEHPYALIIFIVEAVVVSQLYRRGICNLIMAGFVYWLLIGVPLILFLYYNQLGMSWQDTFLIGLKQPLNGLFNVLMTDAILIALKLLWPKTKSFELAPLHLANLLFHGLLTMPLLIGGVAIVYDGYEYRSLQESVLVEKLTARTANLVKQLKSNPRANLAIELESDMAIAVVTNDGRILSNQGEIVSNTAPASQLLKISDDLSLWLPEDNKSLLQRFAYGRYVVHVPLDGLGGATHLIIEQSAATLVDKLGYRTKVLLLYLSVLLILGVLFSFFISHLLTLTLKKIVITGQNLSSKITNDEHIIFPSSVVHEYDSLSATLKTMAYHLATSFKSLRLHEATLEETVKLKTLELEDSQARLVFAIEGVGDGIWDWDVDSSTVDYSPLWMSMLGYQENELPQHMGTFTSLLHPEDKSYAQQTMQDYLAGELKTYTFEVRLRCKNDSYIWILSRGMAVRRDNHNKPLRIVGTQTDITQRKKNEQTLKLDAIVFTHACEGIIIIDALGHIIKANNTFTDITGYSHKEVVGQSLRMLLSDKQLTGFYDKMWAVLLEKNYWKGELWNQDKSGKPYAAQLNISAVHNTTGQVENYVAIFDDITLQKEHQSQLDHMAQLERIAHYDILTDLPNRLLLADRLSQSILQCKRNHTSLAVAFLDLDNFKAVNDAHGHHSGDELLIIVSRRMEDALREADTLARIGGDEFIVVLAGLEKIEDYQPILERLRLAVSKPITIEGVALQVSASIGIALYPQDSPDADMLMRHADQAMYVAKQAGKNRYHLFDTVQDNAINTQRKNIGDIGSALERREFVLHYQPKVNMHTGEVISVEALIRWQHPDRGLVPPLEFLPQIEGQTISLELGEWVIDNALSQISQWQNMGVMLPISVNISAYQLQQPNFPARLSALLAAHPEVNPQSLEFEILETSALDNVNQVATTMNACQELGLRFALDDFGTGHSSLTHLRRLPAYLIKIDQSFVRDMLKDADALAIVEGVVGLAKAFQREVIAEGVETITHGVALLKLGCELAQGYGIARPMPADDIPKWVSSWKADDAWQAHSSIESDLT
ncbi:MAG: diguanylate cyclase (GGDEF)-like protein/PAS domain S-box-containing protein [Patiriisocius sp.]|jgi:diguanylate cyclase (GGDEF)-like protein/PAS domain S-box-containing protein